MLITPPIVVLSIVYSLIFIFINKIFKRTEVYTRSIKTFNSIRECKRKNYVTKEQYHEIMNNYKIILKKETEIFIVSIIIFALFYYYIIPTFIGIYYQITFITLTIIFSILIIMFLYISKKINKKH